MENTSTYFECEIDKLSYVTIERKISQYFDMGFPNSSGLPAEMQENSSVDCALACDKMSGNFHVTNYKLKNGKYLLSVRLTGKLSKRRR